jgi:PAS domain S-box-containing protein
MSLSLFSNYRLKQLEALLEISRALTEELDLERVLSRVLRVSAELLGSHAGLIALREDENGWRIAVSYGINQEVLKHFGGLLDDIPDHGDPARFALPEINRRLQSITKAASMGLLSGVGLPLIAQHEVIGVIFVFRAYRARFSSEDRNLLSAFASQAAIAAQNAKLFSEINQQKQHLDAVLDSAADGILMLDSNFRILRVNRTFARLTGYDQVGCAGKKHDDLIRWLRKETGDSLEEARAAGWPQTEQATLYVEGDLITNNGGALSVGITYAPAIDDSGNLLSIVATLRDITKFREAEELKSTFISIISHELRTPVALIKGYVGTLRREDAKWDPEVVRDSLAVIEEESDRLASLIDDLLEASRLQAGALELKRSEVALDELATRMAQRFQTQSEEHSIEVEFEGSLPAIPADENRLMQVLGNLVSNAIKYSPDGGTIKISGRQQKDHIVICVQDQGPGIALEDVPRIFNLFYRSNQAARKTKGAGLGLFLAKAIVEAHGGKIWVDDRIKQGARICFSLPKSQRPLITPPN